MSRSDLRVVGGASPSGATAHNAEAEVAVLATVLDEPRVMLPRAVALGLLPSHFHFEANGRVWGALSQMAEIQDAQLHPVMVSQWLHDRGGQAPEGGWTAFLRRSSHMAGAPLADVVQLVIELADIRGVQGEAEAIALEAKGPIKDRRAWCAAVAERMASRLTPRIASTPDFDQILGEVFDEFDAPGNQLAPGEVLGYSTGFRGVDERIGGLVAAELIMLTGQEKSGKSSLGALWCANVARRPRCGQRVGALILQWEDPRQKTIGRLVGARARVDLARRRAGTWMEHDQNEFTSAANELRAIPLAVEDECAPNVVTIAARVRAVRDEMAAAGVLLGAVMIDSLQALEHEGQNREQQLESVMKKLVALKRAKDLAQVSWLLINHTGEDGEMVNARRAPRRWCNTWLDLRVEGKDKEERDGARPAALDLKLARDVEWGISVPLWCYRSWNNLFMDGAS